MLRAGVPVDCWEEYNQTALHSAAWNNHIDVANVLMENGANINQQDRHGITSLMRAATVNSTDIMEVLLHHDADRYIVDEGGKTALDWARLFSRKEAIRLLEKY